MKPLLAAAVVVLVSSLQAQAQSVTINGGGDSNLPEAYSVRLPIRVVESFSVPLTATDAANTAGTDQIEAARKQLYRMMQQECSALSESFSADCRIASFSISLARNFVPAGTNAVPSNGPNLRSVDASVSYGLRVKD
jgi:hypothetical protein